MNPAKLSVGLIEPEIPQNTGNIGRTCVALNVPLYLVGSLGFSLDDRYLKRAGLDYWPKLDLRVEKSVEAFLESPPGKRIVLTKSWGGCPLYDFSFEEGDLLLFGKESVGLSEEIFTSLPSHHVTIPMVGATRSLNLGNSVAITIFEAFRQMHHRRGIDVFKARWDSVQAKREAEEEGPR